MYGAPRPLNELLRRIRPVGIARPALPALAGDAAERHAAAKIERDAIEVGVGAGTGDAGHARLGSVIAELGFVEHGRRQHLAQADHRILRHDGGVVQAERGILGLRRHALIAEIARIQAVLRAEVVVEAESAEFSVTLAGAEMLMISRAGRREANCPTGNAPSRGRMAGAIQFAVAPPTHRARANGGAQRALHDGRRRVLPQPFVAGEEEGFVLDDRSADASRRTG